MYRCSDCGHLFEEGEQEIWEERHGLDTPPYEKFSGCPLCRGNYEVADTNCKICGCLEFESNLIGGICEDCFEEYSSDMDVCYKTSKEEFESVKLNAFISKMFDSETIEEILLDYLKENPKYIESHKENLEDFIDEDKYWFCERLVEVLENEDK